jgi:cytochrome c-type biogenesis protein CcmF
VHLAVIIMVVAITASQSYKRTAEASLAPGESVQIGDFQITFVQTDARQEPHRFSLGARLSVSEGGESLGELVPALNFYETQREPVGTPAVRTLARGDLYISLLHVERDGSRVAIKVFFLPLVAYLWWSIPLLVLGSAIALWPRRRAVPTVVPADGVPAA